MESVPQVYVLSTILGLSGPGSCEEPVNIDDTLFLITFSTSIASASFGISKFIKSGPARIVRNDKCLMGFGTLSFILIFTNIALTVVGKGFVISSYLGNLAMQTPGMTYLPLVLVCFIPQLLHVSLNIST